VLIDLESNPEARGIRTSRPPKKTRTPLHLKPTASSSTRIRGRFVHGKVEFQTPQAFGSAMGIQYEAKTGTMKLAVGGRYDRQPAPAGPSECGSWRITKQPHQVVLTTVHMTRRSRNRDPTGDVLSARRQHGRPRSCRGQRGDRHSWQVGNARAFRPRRDVADRDAESAHHGLLTGNVQLHSEGTQTQGTQPATLPLERPRCTLPGSKCSRRFMPKTACGCRRRMPRAGACLRHPPVASVEGRRANSGHRNDGSGDGLHRQRWRLLENAETSGPPRIVITQPDANQKTWLPPPGLPQNSPTKIALATLHGEPDAKIVGSLIDPNKTDASKAGSTKAGAPAQPDRVSTSQMLDVAFLPEAESGRSRRLATLLTRMARRSVGAAGRVHDRDQMLVLNGSPRVVDTGMTTTARHRMNRATGDAFAEAT